MNSTKKYLSYLAKILEETAQEEEEALFAAAELVTESLLNGGRFYVFGTGHSHLIAEELYVRAGGLALVNAILPPELLLDENLPTKSTAIERIEGYSSHLFDLYGLEKNDCLMVISNSGRNNVPVEMCLKAKEHGLSVIAMTSKAHSSEVPSRHKSGKRIHEIADVVIDNHAPKGDAAFYVEGVEAPVGPVSDFTGIALAQALIVTVTEQLEKAGFNPPIFNSSNVEGGDEKNQALFNQYFGYKK